MKSLSICVAVVVLGLLASSCVACTTCQGVVESTTCCVAVPVATTCCTSYAELAPVCGVLWRPRLLLERPVITRVVTRRALLPRLRFCCD